jgi:Na+-driven multidrug efflux pump
VLGSSFGIGFGLPVLLLVNFAGRSEKAVWIALGIVFVYMALLLFIIFKTGRKKQK